MNTVTIKGTQYIPVNERIKHFRENFKGWSLTSEIVSLENGVCVIKATISDDNGIVKATGFAYEKESSSFINKTSYIENCETSAWGRALGNLGIGIDVSIASAEEVSNAILNQNKPKPVYQKKVDTSKGFEGATNKDADIYISLAKISEPEAIESFYELNKDSVENKEKFEQAFKSHYKSMKKINDEFMEEIPF